MFSGPDSQTQRSEKINKPSELIWPVEGHELSHGINTDAGPVIVYKVVLSLCDTHGHPFPANSLAFLWTRNIIKAETHPSDISFSPAPKYMYQLPLHRLFS